MSKKPWTVKTGEWCWSESGEQYGDTFETREQAIAQALEEIQPEEPHEIHVARVGDIPDVTEAICCGLDRDSLEETAEEYLCANYHAEESKIDATEAQWTQLAEAIRETVESWAKTHHIEARWYLVDSESVEKVMIS